MENKDKRIEELQKKYKDKAFEILQGKSKGYIMKIIEQSIIESVEYGESLAKERAVKADDIPERTTFISNLKEVDKK